MRFRGLVAMAILLSIGALFSSGNATAASTPRCNGKVATIVGSGYIEGTDGDDVIVGSKGADTIDGKGGRDTICGLDGDDEIWFTGWADGGNGSDDLHAFQGSLGMGGSGNDQLWAEYGSTVLGGSGNDEVNAESGSTGDGGSGDDTMYGYGAYKLLGGSGKDSLSDYGYTSFMDCGPDRDTFRSKYYDGGPTIRRCENEGDFEPCACLMVPDLTNLAARLDRFA